MPLFTRTAKLDPGAHGARCAWATAVHRAVGISRQKNSGYRLSRVNIMAQGLFTPDPFLSRTHLSIRRGRETTTHYTHHQVSLMVSRNTTLVPSVGLRFGTACQAGLRAGIRRERVPPIRRRKSAVLWDSLELTARDFLSLKILSQSVVQYKDTLLAIVLRRLVRRAWRHDVLHAGHVHVARSISSRRWSATDVVRSSKDTLNCQGILVFRQHVYSNRSSNKKFSCRRKTVQCFVSVTVKKSVMICLAAKSLKIIETGIIRKLRRYISPSIVLMALSCIEIKWDIRRKSLFFIPSLHSTPTLMEVPVGILPYRLVCNNYKLVWLPDGEKSVMICLIAVSIEYRRVTDGHTDRQTTAQSALCIASRCTNGLVYGYINNR